MEGSIMCRTYLLVLYQWFLYLHTSKRRLPAPCRWLSSPVKGHARWQSADICLSATNSLLEDQFFLIMGHADSLRTLRAKSHRTSNATHERACQLFQTVTFTEPVWPPSWSPAASRRDCTVVKRRWFDWQNIPCRSVTLVVVAQHLLLASHMQSFLSLYNCLIICMWHNIFRGMAWYRKIGCPASWNICTVQIYLLKQKAFLITRTVLSFPPTYHTPYCRAQPCPDPQDPPLSRHRQILCIACEEREW